MDENTAGAGQFEMVPAEVIGTSRSFAGAAAEMPPALTDAVTAALRMLTANPGFASSAALRAAVQVDLTAAVGGVSAETDDGARLLKTMAEKTLEADAESRGRIRTQVESWLPAGDDPGVHPRGEV